MSNKFWAAGSDSDSESSEASSSGSDDDRQVGGRATGRFQMSDSSSGMLTWFSIYFEAAWGESRGSGNHGKVSRRSLATFPH